MITAAESGRADLEGSRAGGHEAGYISRIGQYGWRQFTEELRVDEAFLISQNHGGNLLPLCNEHYFPLAPEADGLRAYRAELRDDPKCELLNETKVKERQWQFRRRLPGNGAEQPF